MLFLFGFIQNLLKIFKKINLVSIKKEEQLALSLIRSINFSKFLYKYYEVILENHNDNSKINICADFLAEFKVSLLNLLKNYSLSNDFEILFKESAKNYYTNVLNIVYMGIIGQMYDYFCCQTGENKKKLTYSKFKEKLAISKQPTYNNLYNLLEGFFNEFQESSPTEKTFKQIYKLYKKKISFSLDVFIEHELLDVKLEIIETYEL
uniref:hypothetical protein n=1 Tax=Ulva meridionalis TaxID=434723 RepID=UPI0028E0A183|nr:hypothetical protein NQY40_pgp081 [Ulva meridionalis]WFS80030.1 hypothetical protein [Ulva meridionalis]